MTRLRFLAPTADQRPGKEGTVYGAGHETDFDEEDYEFVKTLRLEGRAEITDATPPPPPEGDTETLEQTRARNPDTKLFTAPKAQQPTKPAA